MCATRSRPTSAAAKRPRGRPRKKPDERNEGNRRQGLIKAAANLFRRHGFNGTSTRSIASAAGMHSGSLFCHFKSKDALLYEVMQEGMRSALARQTIVLLAKHDAATTLRQLIRLHFDTLLGSNGDFIWAAPRHREAGRRLQSSMDACTPRTRIDRLLASRGAPSAPFDLRRTELVSTVVRRKEGNFAG